MKKFDKIILSCLLIISMLSATRYLNMAEYWLADMFSHFPVQYAFFALSVLAVCIWKKNIPFAIFAGLLFAFNISVLGDAGATVQAAGPAYKTFTVYSANINKSNRDFPRLVAGLRETDADILLILEATEENIRPLHPLIREYPYSIVNLNIGSSGTGTALMSKFPILKNEIEKYSEFGNMLVSATLQINGKKVLFYGTHFPKPLTMKEFTARSMQIISLADKVNEQSVPVIVAGDFNATPYSPAFKKLLRKSGLKDSREGFGWQPTWPTQFPLLWIPIDHILVSPQIQVHKRATGSFIGSDHYPVFAELSITN